MNRQTIPGYSYIRRLKAILQAVGSRHYNIKESKFYLGTNLRETAVMKLLYHSNKAHRCSFDLYIYFNQANL